MMPVTNGTEMSLTSSIAGVPVPVGTRPGTAMLRDRSLTHLRRVRCAACRPQQRAESPAVADELGRLHGEIGREDSFWPAQLATLAAIVLYLLLPGRLTLGPPWLLPIPEGLLFLGLVLSTPAPKQQRPERHRKLALALIALTAVATIVALVLLAHYLLGGQVVGRSLLGAGVVLWGTIILVSALAYWELDGGGPGRPDRRDFLFAQMTDDARTHVGARWRPA